MQIQEQSWSASIFHTLNQSHSCYGDPKCQGPHRIEAQLSPHPASVSSSAERRGTRGPSENFAHPVLPGGEATAKQERFHSLLRAPGAGQATERKAGSWCSACTFPRIQVSKAWLGGQQDPVPRVSLPLQSAHRLLVPHRASLCVRRPGRRAGRQQTLDKYLQIVCGDEA